MTFDEFEAREVAPPRGRGAGVRLAASLVGAGLGVGAIAVAAAVLVGGFAQTEAGLCRLTWAPCTELSLASVASLSGVDLPAGTVVLSGYAEETATVLEFRAEVELPEGGYVALGSSYQQLDGPMPDLVPAAEGADLRYWTSYESVGDGHSGAAEATAPDGRTRLFFDTRAGR